ncbi:MAG: neutral/alkaline non-lysosomal ceramidase N-terminal domain-containing protein [Clostridia bacterium]|nr:neutral/alkaline non-lysosomal ceramidase N-terminal domain-containing protein [Clostridia bacterium]
MESLKLGVARRIITPNIGGQLYGYRPDVFSKKINDDLTVTAFYFKQGETEALLISATVCLIRTSLAEDILLKLEERFKIPKQSIMLNATHTHSGPNTAGETGWGDIDTAYCDGIFVPMIFEAVAEAVDNTQPVKMAVSEGKSLVGINRRELSKISGKILLGQNPDGPFDPKMTVISFADENGKTVANIIHYGCHGTAAGTNTEITRDWSGLMTDAVEEKTGAITAFFNGPEGDVGPRISNGRTVGDLSYVYELGEKAAADAVKLAEKLADYGDVQLKTSFKLLEIPLKKRMPKDEALEALKKYEGQTINVGKMAKDNLLAVVESYNTDFKDEPSRKVAQTVIALGDVVLASTPYETFSEIGLAINNAFPDKKVLTLSNTNGSEGYFITEDAKPSGGYEVSMFLYGHIQQFCDNADIALANETINHIKEKF